MQLTEVTFASCFAADTRICILMTKHQIMHICVYLFFACMSLKKTHVPHKSRMSWRYCICDSNLLPSHHDCILTNPSGPSQPAGGGPAWLPVEKTRHYCSFFPLISLITFANQINPSGGLWRATSCNLKGPPSNLHLIRCKCVTSVSNQ